MSDDGDDLVIAVVGFFALNILIWFLRWLLT